MIEHRSRVEPSSSTRESDMATNQAAVGHGNQPGPASTASAGTVSAGTGQAGTGQAGTGLAGYPGRWLAAIVMIVGALMDIIDATIVNVALPSISRHLHACATQLAWVVSGYILSFSAALIIAGNLGDKFGR